MKIGRKTTGISLLLSLALAVTMAFAAVSISYAEDQDDEWTTVEIESVEDMNAQFEWLENHTNWYGKLKLVLQTDIVTDKGYSVYNENDNNEFVLDLNGHSITVNSNEFMYYNVLTLSGKTHATITGNGTLRNPLDEDYTYPTAVNVYDSATVTIENGTFDAKKPVSVSDDLMGEEMGTVTINGGTFIGENPLTSQHGNIIVNDGHFVCKRYTYDDDGADYADCIEEIDYQPGKIVIHGGTFENTVAPSGAFFSNNCNVVIDGGKFIGNQLLHAIVWWSDCLKMEISGGDFTEAGNIFRFEVSAIPTNQLKVTGGTFTDEQREEIRLANELGDAEYPQLTNLSKYSVSKLKDRIYTGKKQTPLPTLTVKLNKTDEPYELKNTKDRFYYKASYKNNLGIGTATVTLTGAGEVKGKRTVTFRILPAKAALKSVSKGKKSFTVKIKAQKGGVKYQVQYRKGTGKWISKKTPKTSLKIKKLKSKKTYQVRVRAYKVVGGKTYYGAWSKVKKVKVK